jgi:hypothetical protein
VKGKNFEALLKAVLNSSPVPIRTEHNLFQQLIIITYRFGILFTDLFSRLYYLLQGSGS